MGAVALVSGLSAAAPTSIGEAIEVTAPGMLPTTRLRP
jgi:hypothetical protein